MLVLFLLLLVISAPLVIAQEVSADLLDIIISGEPSNFVFESDKKNYEGVTVANNVESITVSPVGEGIIKVEGEEVASGEASEPIALEVGIEKAISVVVTETDKAPNTYTIKVARVLAEAPPTPTFNPEAGSAAFGAELEIISVGADAIYYTTDGTDPATEVVGTTLLYNADDKPVIDRDMTVKAIAVKTGAENSDIGEAAYIQTETADLISIELSGHPLNFNFEPNVYEYEGVIVPTEARTVNITVTSVGNGAITVQGVEVASGEPSGNIELEKGEEVTTITVEVREDGKIPKIYTVKVTARFVFDNDNPEHTTGLICLTCHGFHEGKSEKLLDKSY